MTEALTFGIFGRSVARNPWPVRKALKGYPVIHIEKTAKQCIAQALTFHEMPRNVDDCFDSLLPDDDALQLLPQTRKDYLSFTVYSLKQMVAASTISADMAWSLFHWEWNRIGQVTDDNFIGMRQAFFMHLADILKIEVGETKFGEVTEKYSLVGQDGRFDLLRWEFLARLGEAGLSRFDDYQVWAERLAFGEESFAGTCEAVKNEYRIALWLEMRLIEQQTGVRGINRDVGKFILNRTAGEGEYNERANYCITASIDIFSIEEGHSIDAKLKAEIGHWLLGDLLVIPTWVSELQDRMSAGGFTGRVADALALGGKYNDLGSVNLPPEAVAFLWGGHFPALQLNRFEGPYIFNPYLIENKSGYWYSTLPRMERHPAAEVIDYRLRFLLTSMARSGKLARQDFFEYYKIACIYLYLCALQIDYFPPDLDLIDHLEPAKVRAEVDRFRSNPDQYFIDALQTGNDFFKRSALYYFMKKRVPASLEHIRALLFNSSDEILRIDAASALITQQGKECLPDLIQAESQMTDRQVKEHVLKIIARLQHS